MTKPSIIPPALKRAGITHVTHDLPAGAEVNFGADFVRIFRAEIEEKLYGFSRPVPAVIRKLPGADK